MNRFISQRLSGILTFSIMMFIGAIVLSGCVDCKECNMTFTGDQLEWIPYESGQLITFSSISEAPRYFRIGTEEISADTEICGNTDKPCTIEKGFDIYETDILNSWQDYVGDIYMFTTEDGYFAGVFNLFDGQLYQNGLDSIFALGGGDMLVQQKQYLFNDSILNSVYELQIDSSSADTINHIVRIYYHADYGLLQFNNQGGSKWYRSDLQAD
jgi:hypothetical protein